MTGTLRILNVNVTAKRATVGAEGARGMAPLVLNLSTRRT